MKNDNIDILLSRYLDGMSTLDEERTLREYFSGAAVDERHMEYRDMFLAFDDISVPGALEGRLNGTIDALDRVRSRRHFRLRRFMIRVSAIAACLAVILTVAISSGRPDDEDVLCGMTPEEVATNTAMAIQLMSRTINAGSSSASQATAVTIEMLNANIK